MTVMLSPGFQFYCKNCIHAKPLALNLKINFLNSVELFLDVGNFFLWTFVYVRPCLSLSWYDSELYVPIEVFARLWLPFEGILIVKLANIKSKSAALLVSYIIISLIEHLKKTLTAQTDLQPTSHYKKDICFFFPIVVFESIYF